ncbi:hypothetical protein [Actinomadura formosensis]|uniref:hypothetical protein n=1 Tax=Actinomadura formosensis TaxID=60706 RepID=UPI003D8E717D
MLADEVPVAAALGEHQAHPGVDDLLFVKVSTALATRSLRIEPSRLGEQAGLTGCAAMVLDNILSPEAIDTAAH